MSSFDRRLQALHRRPEATPGAAAVTAVATVTPSSDAASIGWLAAERLSRLGNIEPGVSIVLAVDKGDDHAMVEVTWAEDGVAAVREL